MFIFYIPWEHPGVLGVQNGNISHKWVIFDFRILLHVRKNLKIPQYRLLGIYLSGNIEMTWNFVSDLHQDVFIAKIKFSAIFS